MGKWLFRIVSDQWRGASSLPVSFFCWGVLEKVVELSLAYLFSLLLVAADSPVANLFALLAFVGTTEGLSILWWVGTWRSASKREKLFSKKGWSYLAKLSVCVLLLIDIINLAEVTWPEAKDLISDAREDPQWGARGISIATDKRSLTIYGHITRSTAVSLRQALAEDKTISTVYLDSFGGRLGPALAIEEAISRHNIDTVVDRTCVSACIVAFLGGKRRWVTEKGRLGFHAAGIGGSVLQRANDKFREEALARGVSEGFLEKAVSSGRVWYPSITELKSSRVITGVWPRDENPPSNASIGRSH